MPATHVPKYPVVDPEPETSFAISNFNFNDMAHVGAFTVSGYLVGWFGARKPFRPSNSKFLAGVGLLGGMFYGVMRSTQRLAGLEPNASEVARYGALTSEQLASRLSKINVPNGNLIDEKRN